MIRKFLFAILILLGGVTLDIYLKNQTAHSQTMNNEKYLTYLLKVEDDTAEILAQKHALYIKKRFELLKKLYQADSSAFKKYAELIFWEINSVFPENVDYREKIEKLEKENPSISAYHKAERKAWEKYKELENKYY